jgi:hypothetical protein
LMSTAASLAEFRPCASILLVPPLFLQSKCH